MLHDPDILLLDEPLNGLDVSGARQLRDLVLAWAEKGKTVLYCSHILDVVERVCERVVIIHEGRIVADGSVPELLARSGTPTLETAFNKLTATENLLERAEEFARALSR